MGTKTGRNEPCPCGSGRKFKHCCLPKEESRGTPLSPETIEAARLEPTWEVDVVPLPIALDDDPDCRPGGLWVLAGGLVVYSEILSRPPAETEELAREFERGIQAAAGVLGCYPEEIVLRHSEIRAELEPRLAGKAIVLTVSPHLHDLDEMAASLMGEWEDLPVRPFMASPESWAGWDLPEPVLVDLLAAAAHFHATGPWERLPDDDVIEALVPGERRWYVSVLGALEEPPGFIMFRDLHDLVLSRANPAPEEMSERVRDRSFILLFRPRDDLPRPMQREMASAGWPIANPAAYPRITSVNTPGGGLSRRDAEDLTLLLRAVAGLVRKRGDELLEDEWTPWKDPGTGVELELLDGEPSSDFGSPLQQILDDAARAELQQLFAGEEPPAFDDVASILDGVTDRHNRRPDDELGGLSPSQVNSLLLQKWNEPGGPLFFARDLPFEEISRTPILRNARTFLEALVREDGTRATSAGNLNRAFVRTMLKEGEWPERHIEILGDYRQVVNEGDVFPLHTLRILLDISGLIRKLKGRFVVTRRGREALPEERAGDLFARLFETQFLKMNLAYLDGAEVEGEVQRGIPYSLCRLRDTGRDWSTPEELVDSLFLPFVRESIPAHAGFSHAALVLRTRLLDVLVRFGLVETQELPGKSRWSQEYRYRVSPLFDRFLSFDIEAR